MKNFLLLPLICLSFACSQVQNTTSDQSKKNANAIEALLVGTFHYNNPGADVAKTKSFNILSDTAQYELNQMSKSITAYKPSKIFVEWPYNEQKELDSLYDLYKRGRYFTNDSLSEFYLKNEIFQLAFKVAKENNLETVYGIDYKTSFPFGEVMSAIEKNNQTALKKKIQNGITQFTVDFDNKIADGVSLTDLTYYLNSPKLRELSNDFHNNLMLEAGELDDLSGPFLTSEWYKRNVYMWSFIEKQTITVDERIMVLVGASHAAMFEVFINGNRAWKVKELQDIMRQ
ncbi:MAG: hypothetical protein K0U54_08270 [Bacteroidetes bacterium]|nr:hypothetical protein [Bacteroidota bacterium]